jgi:hypothetical protein
MLNIMAKDPNFVSVRLPDDVANWLREYATANKMVRADKPNMGGSIISVIRGVISGQTISNNVGQSSAAPDVDIDAKINEAIANLRASINDELVDIKQAIAAITSKATEPEKKSIKLLKVRLSALAYERSNILHKKALDADSKRESTSSLEPETLPIIEAIENIAAPTVEKSLDSNVSSDAIASTAKPKSTKRSAKSKAILTRPEALAIAQNFGFNGTGQNLYDWSKAALTAKSEESRLANSEKLAAVGLVAVLSPESKPVWQAKN